MKEEIDIEIDPSGKLRIHIRGIKGKKCLERVADLERALGKVAERKLTSEYYESPPDVEIRKDVWRK